MKMNVHAIAMIVTMALGMVSGGAAASAGEAPEPLTVAIASNLSGVMGELKGLFLSEYPGVKLEIVTGSSGKLAAQALNGAPFDVFLSADMEYPRKLREGGCAAGEPVPYARGTLVMFTVRDIGLGTGIAVVVSTSVARVAVADPGLAPYGRAAVEAMKKAGVLERAQPKFVVAASISDAVTMTVNGADVGFTALSLMYSPGIERYNRKGRYWVEVDRSLYAPIEQGMVLLSHGKDNPAAKAFYVFILSPKAKRVFRKYGYR